MPTRRIFSGAPFEAEIGYARAVVRGGFVFVSGTTGFDYRTMTIVPDIAAQTEQALLNIGAPLAEAGCGFRDVLRVHYILSKGEEFPACFPVLRRYFGAAPPVATMIEARLMDARMKIEIEVTAAIP